MMRVCHSQAALIDEHVSAVRVHSTYRPSVGLVGIMLYLHNYSFPVMKVRIAF